MTPSEPTDRPSDTAPAQDRDPEPDHAPGHRPDPGAGTSAEADTPPGGVPTGAGSEPARYVSTRSRSSRPARLPATIEESFRATLPLGVHPVAFEPRALRRSVITVLVLITLWLGVMTVLSSVSSFLFLLLLSLLIAIAMEPAVNWLGERGMGRGPATAVVGGVVLVTVLVLGAVLSNLFFTQLAALVQAAPTVVTNVIGWANRTFSLKLDADSVASGLRLDTAQVGSMASQLAGGVLGLVSGLLTALLDLFTVVVFAFYLTADGPRVRRAIGSWLPPSQQDVFVTVWDIAVAKTGGYVVSKVELAVLSAVFHGAFFWVIGVPYWLPLAIFVGILAQFAPVIGTYLGIVVPVLFVVFTAPWTALWIVLFATVYQQVETYVFTPRVSRRTMDVNSGIALAAVFVGTSLWGPIGALIGIPIAAAIVAVLDTYGHRYDLVPALARPADD